MSAELKTKTDYETKEFQLYMKILAALTEEERAKEAELAYKNLGFSRAFRNKYLELTKQHRGEKR